MADTRQELETAVFDLAASVATVRAALSAAITNDVDQVGRLDVLEGCYRVRRDASRGGPGGTAPFTTLSLGDSSWPPRGPRSCPGFRKLRPVCPLVWLLCVPGSWRERATNSRCR